MAIDGVDNTSTKRLSLDSTAVMVIASTDTDVADASRRNLAIRGRDNSAHAYKTKLRGEQSLKHQAR